MTANTAALGLLRIRWARRGTLTLCRNCPDCGHRIRDRDAARLGFCDRCREFTGMCGAGRTIVCPDMMTKTTWHMPCTRLGTTAWEITMSEDPRRTVLCETHDAQLRSRPMPWITVAVPLPR